MGDRFGMSVAISEDAGDYYAVIGAYRCRADIPRTDRDDAAAVEIGGRLFRYNGNNQDTVGKAYVFHQSGSSWPEVKQLDSGDGAVGNFFGISVDIDGDVLGGNQTS